MSDTTAPPASPLAAIAALERHVQLRNVDRIFAVAFLLALRPGQDDPSLVEANGGTADPFSLLVASDAFGRQLALRLKSGEPNPARAFLHLLLDQPRLQSIIAEAGLQTWLNTFDWD